MTLASILNDTDPWLIGGAVAIIAIVSNAVASVLRTRAKERSRREIAAYIAEGSISPEQGERLMQACADPRED
jgi:hypothetical protein